jgi:glycine/D-amino acid oxidase-like deaminating enzyme
MVAIAHSVTKDMIAATIAEVATTIATAGAVVIAAILAMVAMAVMAVMVATTVAAVMAGAVTLAPMAGLVVNGLAVPPERAVYFERYTSANGDRLYLGNSASA